MPGQPPTVVPRGTCRVATPPRSRDTVHRVSRRSPVGHRPGVGTCADTRPRSDRPLLAHLLSFCRATATRWLATGSRVRSTAHCVRPSTLRRHSHGRQRGHGRGRPSGSGGCQPRTQPQVSTWSSTSSPVLSCLMCASLHGHAPTLRSMEWPGRWSGPPVLVCAAAPQSAVQRPAGERRTGLDGGDPPARCTPALHQLRIGRRSTAPRLFRTHPRPARRGHATHL